jgi:hypothetical protein
MRYLVKSKHVTAIWPQDLSGLTSALKQAMSISKQWPDEVVTISVHAPGNTVAFRKFKDQQEVWRSEPVDG